MILDKFLRNIENLYRNEQSLAVAVSGGSDSVALLHLLSCWSRGHNLSIVVIYIDHNLRPESKSEVSFVHRLANSLGYKFVTFSWNHENNEVNLQERAREGRYSLMTDFMRKENINLLLTAHHQDDMIETYLMRSGHSKIEGIFGLKSSHIHFWNNIRIIRPLFDVSKKDIIDYLSLIGASWMEDSSNALDKYERNRLRKNISSYTFEQRNKILDEIERVSANIENLNESLIEAIAESVAINNFGFAKIYLPKFFEYDYAIRLQILNYILTIVGGHSSVPRYRNTKMLLAKIDEGQNINCTLHGCVLNILQDDMVIYREEAAIASELLPVKTGYIWDNRFLFTFFDAKDENLLVSKLHIADYAEIRKKLDLSSLRSKAGPVYKKILFTLPVIKHADEIVLIPHIAYYKDNSFCPDNSVKVIFRTNFISRFTHFTDR